MRTTALRLLRNQPRRCYSSSPSPHAQVYTDLLPSMVPVALLGSAIYLGLHLTRSTLSHERHLDLALARVAELEAEVDALQAANTRRDAAPAGVSPTPSSAKPSSSSSYARPYTTMCNGLNSNANFSENHVP